MMHNRLCCVLIVGICLVVASCTTIQYDGDTRVATAKIDVYKSDKEVQRTFTVLGQIKATAQANRVSEDHMRQRVIEEAKKRGADAVVFLSSEQGLVADHDYFRESRERDRNDEFTGPAYDRVRILKAQLIAYTDAAGK